MQHVSMHQKMLPKRCHAVRGRFRARLLDAIAFGEVVPRAEELNVLGREGRSPARPWDHVVEIGLVRPQVTHVAVTRAQLTEQRLRRLDRRRDFATSDETWHGRRLTVLVCALPRGR